MWFYCGTLAYSKFSFSPFLFTKENDERIPCMVKAVLIPLPNKPLWLAKVVISTPLSRQQNYIHELEIHKQVLVKSEVRILNFCHMATYIFQAFIIFSQPTRVLIELLQFICHFTINLYNINLEQIRALQTK